MSNVWGGLLLIHFTGLGVMETFPFIRGMVRTFKKNQKQPKKTNNYVVLFYPVENGVTYV